jgi:UDP-glucuronate decarboxylase
MADKHIFEKKNAVVTGGAGFIGSYLCDQLLRDDYRVICIDNFVTSTVDNINYLLKNPDFEFLRLDVSEPFDLESFSELERFKVPFQGIQEVYHLACPMSAKNFEKFRHQTLMANSVGMRNALELARKYESKFFQASTSVVYGPRGAEAGLVKEDYMGCPAHLTPRSCYDEGRRWAETMVQTYKEVHGLDIRIGRLFRTYGPRTPISDGHMVPDFILDALDDRPLTIYGDEGFRTSLLYVTDAVDAITRLMRLNSDPGPVNIGSDADLRLFDVAHQIIEMTGSKSEVTFADPLPFMTELALPDLTKIKDELGWIPLVTLNQGLKKSIEYTVANKGLLKPFMSE